MDGSLFGQGGAIQIFDLPGAVDEEQVAEATRYLKTEV
jgi:hypothetical protein